MKSFALILLLGLMWGPSFLLIKLGLEGGLPPLTLAFLRVSFAALFLWLFVLIRNSAFPTTKHIYLHAAVIAIFSQALPFALINVAEQYIDSALAGVINGITPIVTALLAHVLIHDEKLTLRRTLGIVLGVIGFLILLLPGLWGNELEADVFSVLGVGLAAICYAIGIIYGRLFLCKTKTLVIPALQVSFAACYLLPLTLLTNGFSDITQFSYSAWLSVLALAFWGTACAFVLYFYVLQHYGAIALGTSTFLLPIFSIFFGIIFLDEQLSWLIYLGTLFILSGMKLVHSR